MRIQKRHTLFYSTLFTVILASILIFVYSSYSSFRKQEFYTRISDKLRGHFSEYILDTVRIVHDESMFKMSVRLIDERYFILDHTGRIVYRSNPMYNLSATEKEKLSEMDGRNSRRGTDGTREYVIFLMTNGHDKYIGIGSAYDQTGRKKLNYLALVLLGSFVAGLFLTIVSSSYLARLISSPLENLSRQLSAITDSSLSRRVILPHQRRNDEIDLLADSFNRMLERLESTFEMQKNVMHQVSHEMRTPLAVLVARMDEVIRMETDEKKRELLGEVRMEAMDLSSLLTSILEISKLQNRSTSYILSTLRMDDVVLTCMRENQRQFPDVQMEFNMDCENGTEDELTVEGNDWLITAAVKNLIRNASTYNEDNRIKILIRSSENKVILDVVNYFTPVPPEERRKMFNMFFRASNSLSKTGYGLGLAMVKQIADLHRGKIEYLNPGGNENIFRLTLPVKGI